MVKDKLIKGNIEIRKSPIHRYGVFATDDIKNGTIIEEVLFILLTDDYFGNDLDIIDDYIFGSNETPEQLSELTAGEIGKIRQWAFRREDKPNKSFLAFGYAPVYNHSSEPNIQADLVIEDDILMFTTIKDIKKDEELFHDYGEGWLEDREFDLFINKLQYDHDNNILSLDEMKRKLYGTFIILINKNINFSQINKSNTNIIILKFFN